MECLIGSKSLLFEIPKLLHIGGRPWILANDSKDNPAIYDALCVHHHGTVSELKKDKWICPNHFWEFDPKTGNSVTHPTMGLQSYPIVIKDDELYAELPISFSVKPITKSGPKIPPKISLPCNAGLLFEWKGFNILCDPCMFGPCMLGSWTNYPPHIDVGDLPKIDALWISHEHSDHYHEPTLSLFDKNIPVYVTKFDDKRLASRIKKLGFKNVIEIRTGEPIHLTDDITLISFKSASIWNDSISYWKFGNFSILNVNDAGFNWKIKDEIGEADVICLQFTGPTSSYPIVWSHLSDNEKRQIQLRMNAGMLRMFKSVAETCNSTYVLPFANFFELANPEHLSYNKITVKNSLQQVNNFFSNTNLKVLDLIPGESWDNGKFSRLPDREKFFDEEFKLEFLKNTHEKEKDMDFVPKSFDIDHKEIKKYFEEFSGSELAKNVGNYRISFSTSDEHRTLNALITFNDGEVKYESDKVSEKSEMTMYCPGRIVQEVIRKDLSWDEAYNGFWCTFSRNPDVYNINLWKLLYAPWRARPDYVERTNLEYDLNPITLSIADIIEKGGAKASSIFEKYGLFCTGCAPGMGETVEDGCNFHGISKQKTKELMNELETLDYSK
jgi:CMP-N-acetylneuraminate monooxygenase